MICFLFFCFLTQTAFLNVQTQTILTIDDNVITKSARVSIRHSVDPEDNFDGDSDNGTRRLRKTWQLSLKEVTSADAAPYMCQSSGGISQIAYLHVLGTALVHITKLNHWSICNFPF